MRQELIELGATTRSTRPTNYSFSLATFDECIGRPLILVLMPSTAGELLALDAQTATWVIQAIKKLESLGRLQRNWDSYDGLPLSPAAKRTTFEALGWLKNQELPVPAVVLGSGGTVHLEWRSNGKELEIGFDNCGVTEYLKVDDQGQCEEGEGAHEEIQEKIIKLAEWLKNG
jgi:hypothetical protein